MAKICGIDVSKKWIDIFISEHKKTTRFLNIEKGHLRLIKHLKRYKVKQSILESTGGYERELSLCLYSHNCLHSIVDPKKVRAFAKAKGIHAKTDIVDARLLCIFGQELKPEPSSVASFWLSSLRNLINRRAQIKSIESIEKNHIKAPLVTELEKDSIYRVMMTLKSQLKNIDKLIEEKIQENPESLKIYNILQSFKGVGKVSAATLIAYLPELGSVDRKVIASLVGLAPFSNTSGSSIRKNCSIYGGRKVVRDVLYMPTLSAIKTNPCLGRHYRSLISRGKPHKKAMVACMRKMLITLNAMVRDSKTWDNTRFILNKQEYQKL